MRHKIKIPDWLLVLASALIIIASGCKKDIADSKLKGSFDNDVRDVEGNIYKTVKIGTQVWFAENLKTTKYNDGSDIPKLKVYYAGENEVYSGVDSLPIPGYGFAFKNGIEKDKFGAAYNWYTVNTGKLCPMGWHVSRDSDCRSFLPFWEVKILPGES